MMITAEQLSKERNITARAVQKRAKQKGIEKRNGKYVFTQNELKRMYGEQSGDLKYPINERANTHYEPGTNWNERAERTETFNRTEPVNNQHIRFNKMAEQISDGFFHGQHYAKIEEDFSDENLEQKKQKIIQLLDNTRRDLSAIIKSKPTNNQVERVETNFDDIVVR